MKTTAIIGTVVGCLGAVVAGWGMSDPSAPLDATAGGLILAVVGLVIFAVGRFVESVRK